jgi:hypothetical protein
MKNLHLAIAAILSLVPALAHAGYAGATAELSVKIGVTSTDAIGTQWFSLPVGSTGRFGYGIHEENADGTASLGEDGIYTINIFSSADAFSPPNSLSRIGTFVRPGRFAAFTNRTDTAQSISLDIAGNVFLSAFAIYGASNAGGQYSVTGRGHGETINLKHAFAVTDSTSYNDDQSLMGPVVIAPRGIYELFLDFASTRTSAAAVPEPETWVMMLLGSGMIGIQLRRQRRRIAGRQPGEAGAAVRRWLRSH